MWLAHTTHKFCVSTTQQTSNTQPPVSLLWAYGTLFYATQASVHAVLLAASSLSLSNDSSSADPATTFGASGKERPVGVVCISDRRFVCLRPPHPTHRHPIEYGEAAAPRFLDATLASHATLVRVGYFVVQIVLDGV